ncbi:Uncharacterized protein dnm_084850 [Desulfonema magnum]|uniref:Uncharacterized protein n=1 Tax=Desulfonema magnum TaxID=45655 RepID=A0A975BV59_9BACT|nr:Uncharacterized protein dnm_084850 [Desulfonema magnum]
MEAAYFQDTYYKYVAPTGLGRPSPESGYNQKIFSTEPMADFISENSFLIII